MTTINLRTEQFKNQIYDLINQSELPISLTYYIFKEITCLSVLEWNFQNDMTNYIKKLRLFYSRSFFVVSMIIRIIFEKYIKFYNSF